MRLFFYNLCKQDVSENELLKKVLSEMYPSNAGANLSNSKVYPLLRISKKFVTTVNDKEKSF